MSAGHVARMEEMRSGCSILFLKPETKRPLGRSGRRMDLRETGWKDIDLIHLAQDTDQW